MKTSGTTAITTSGTGYVTAIASNDATYNHIVVVNEGSAGGFFTFDEGVTEFRIPAGPSSVSYPNLVFKNDTGVKIKREGDSDMSGVYVTVYLS